MELLFILPILYYPGHLIFTSPLIFLDFFTVLHHKTIIKVVFEYRDTKKGKKEISQYLDNICLYEVRIMLPALNRMELKITRI